MQQGNQLQAGQQAHAATDCGGAVEPLRSAANGGWGSSSQVSDRARALLQECEAFLAADALVADGNAADAVVKYSDFIGTYGNSTLAPASVELANALVKSTAADQLATDRLCRSLDALNAQQLLQPTAQTLPGLLFACGRAYESVQDYAAALAVYGRLRREYPSPEAQTAFANATLAEARALGAGALPAPQAKGSGAGAQQTTVTIRNDSPEGMTIVFSGPEVRVEDLEACTNCASFEGQNTPTGCPELGPVAHYVLAPGTYDVLVKSSSPGVRPFHSNWDLQSTREYASCFFIVRR
jgi:hypothetical protein